MSISRRSLIASVMGATGALAFGARADDKPAPMVIYDDELKNGWQNWSWATVALSVPAGQVKPIKVEGGAWSALALHHDPVSTAGFTKLTFFINGGIDGGQSLAIKLKTGDKMMLAARRDQSEGHRRRQPDHRHGPVPGPGRCLQAVLHHQDSVRIELFQTYGFAKAVVICVTTAFCFEGPP